MVRAFRSDDEGRTVMTADGDAIGSVEAVEDDSVHVKPTAALSQSTRQKLGWTDENEEMYALDHGMVEKIDDAGIHLRDDL
jgi:hypothetical protein